MGILNELYKEKYIFVGEKVYYNGFLTDKEETKKTEMSSGLMGVHTVEIEFISQPPNEDFERMEYESDNDGLYLLKFKNYDDLIPFKIKEIFKMINGNGRIENGNS